MEWKKTNGDTVYTEKEVYSLLSSQKQEHKKEMEELIEEAHANYDFAYRYDFVRIKQSLKSKYLTKGNK